MKDPYQEAAKLLISLDPPHARKLLDSLNNNEKENIFFWIDQLESVPAEESEKLISSFYHYCDDSLHDSLQNSFLKLVENSDPELLQRCLKRESPRAISLLLLFLSEKTVNKILMHMDENQFEEVISEAIELNPEEILQAKIILEEKWGKIPSSPSSVTNFIESCQQALNDEKKIAFLKTLSKEQLTR